ncbi:hypothetical protein [Actinoplanes sp. N902-109]|uniref:8-oxoguanine DNA glycosylase OGG fold protein n=1 Tax=Actinoplanes sp. (strain N902-109) TaxID=649831 RepID=UPI0003293F1C|nr:hypothetical protein [Actinoplanes sp. N902-109]AGL20237.1 hypothetical protein L083_6727 [Actinoplanes sp. N902-109]
MTGWLDAVGGYRSRDEVDGHGFDFRPRWWQTRVPEPSWAAFLDDLREAERGRGYRHITRADMVAVATGPLPVPAVLVAAYAWGTGDGAFLAPRRARVFRDTPPGDLTHRLTGVRDLLATSDAAAAYASLLPGGANRIKHLGPSFFTKLLYALDPSRRALILDRFVAIALRDITGWPLSSTGPWTVDEYTRWLDWAHARAAKDGVHPDAVEMALFSYGKTL